MKAARIMVLVDEQTPTRCCGYVSRSGQPRGWLEIGDRGGLVLLGSPVALRRMSVAVRDAAKEAECLPSYPHAEDDGRPAAA